jgi:HSP20 family protein
MSSLLTTRSSLLPALSNFFDDSFSNELFDWTDRNFSAFGSTLPSANVIENPTNIAIELAAPGLKKTDFKIEVNDHQLSISSEKKEEKAEKNLEGSFRRKEFRFESFNRTFYLPETVDEGKIDATYKDGILHVEVAKKKISSPKSVKTIEIK